MIEQYTIHHLGFVTNSIEDTRNFYEQMGYSAGVVTEDPIQKVYILLLQKEGNTSIELVQPIDDHSSVRKLLKDGSTKPYHVCYQVEDIEKEFTYLTDEQNFIPLFRPVEAVAMGNKLICYLWRSDVGYIELIEK